MMAMLIILINMFAMVLNLWIYFCHGHSPVSMFAAGFSCAITLSLIFYFVALK